MFGAGVAGLTVAHELLERGFAVTVYDPRPFAGGKAHSTAAPGTGTDGRRDLPTEHGYRFFPGNYRHVFDTMERIPFQGQRRGVRDNLVRVPYQQQEYPGCPSLVTLTSPAQSSADRAVAAREFANVKTAGMTLDELLLYVHRRWQFLTSCDERRDTEYEALSWFDFMDVGGRSAAYRDFIGRAPVNFVAARAEVVSMRTMGLMAIQLDRVKAERGNSACWILDGPTNDRWIDPWVGHLVTLGLQRKPGRLHRLVVSGKRIGHAVIQTEAGEQIVTADHYVCAIPVEAMAPIVNHEMAGADPALARIVPLSANVAWMTGMHYFLDYVPRLEAAHQNYIGSPWAVTSIVQSEFWRSLPMNQVGDGRVRAILAVIVSDWDTPGVLFGKPAKQCTPEEIRQEVWHQMRQWGDGVAGEFREDGIRHFALDAELGGDHAAPHYENHAPLFVNLIGSLALRPDAVTGIPNLFLAGDWIKTFTDLATMEAANEAGRRAANGVLAASGVSVARAGVWQPPEPAMIGWWKAYDRRRHRRGLSWDAGAPLWVRWPLVLLLAYIRFRYDRARPLN